MNLEPIIQSEISQKENDKYCIWNLERWYQWSYTQGDTDVKNRLLDSVGEGEGGMIWENSTETCKLPCVKQNDQCKLDAGSRAPKASALEQPREIWWGGRWKVQNGGAAAAAKSCQSCPTLCDPIDGSPTGSSVPGIVQARILAWVAISFSNAWK